MILLSLCPTHPLAWHGAVAGIVGTVGLGTCMWTLRHAAASFLFALEV